MTDVQRTSAEKSKINLDLRTSMTKHFALNSWPWIFLIAIVVSGMAYSVYVGGHVFYHTASWITPGDIWSTFRASQYVTWGGESQIYNNPAAYQTFPGIAVLLAPIARVADGLNLTAGSAYLLPRPSAWLLLGPTELAMGSVLLFPLDRLARRFSFTSRRRVVFLLVEAILIWPTVAMWGHPEDALSLGIGVYALLAAYDGAWLRTSVMMGLAIAVQPLILLVMPIALACLPVRRWPMVTGIAATPALLLLLSPLLQEWGPTIKILTKQPNFLPDNHPTPWVYLAPVITPGHYGIAHVLKYVTLAGGQHRLVEVSTKEFYAPIVAAGPGRIVAIVIACLIGAFVKVRKPSLPQLIWLAALALSLRCLLEPVMVPYYLLPGLALALAVVPLSGKEHWIMAVVLASACTWLSYRHVGTWDYFITMGVPLMLVLFISWPRDVLPSESTSAVSLVGS